MPSCHCEAITFTSSLSKNIHLEGELSSSSVPDAVGVQASVLEAVPDWGCTACRVERPVRQPATR